MSHRKSGSGVAFCEPPVREDENRSEEIGQSTDWAIEAENRLIKGLEEFRRHPAPHILKALALNDLSGEEQPAVEEHLVRCSRCQTAVDRVLELGDYARRIVRVP